MVSGKLTQFHGIVIAIKANYFIVKIDSSTEKDLLLKKMYNEQWILFFEHDPNYQACTIDLGTKNFSMKKPVIISE